MKKLYTFFVNKEAIDESGNKTTEKKEFFIRRSSQAMADDSQLFYGRMFNKAIGGGMMPRAVMEQRYAESGDFFSKAEREDFNKLNNDLLVLRKDLQLSNLIDESNRTKKDKEVQDKILADLISTREKLQIYETKMDSAFDITADSYAKEKNLYWWILFLSYEVVGDKELPFFKGNDYEEKMEYYSDLIDTVGSEDAFLDSLVGKFVTYVSLWSQSGISKPEDFAQAVKFLESGGASTVETDPSNKTPKKKRSSKKNKT